MALIGETSKFFFSQINAEILFLGATAVTPEKGVTCSNLIEAATKKNMIESCEKVCLLIDSSKFGKVAIAHICNWEDIDILITDSISEKDKLFLSDMGVEVIIS